MAGPVGLAAALRRVPLVLMEADSHLGLTNRLLAPLARRVCLAFPIEGRDGRALPRDGPARAAPPATDRAAARARFGIAARRARACSCSGARSGRRSINQAAIEAFAGARFHVLHAAGARDLPELRLAGSALRPARLHLGLRRGAAGQRPGRGALRRLGVRDRRPRAADGAGPVSVCHRRPSDRERAVHGAGRGGGGDPRRRADRAAAGPGGRTAAGRPRTSGGDGQGVGGAGPAAAAQEIADELLAVARKG